MVLFFYWVLLLQFGGAQAGPKNTGTKFVVRYTSGGDTSEFTTYTTGDRRPHGIPKCWGTHHEWWLV